MIAYVLRPPSSSSPSPPTSAPCWWSWLPIHASLLLVPVLLPPLSTTHRRFRSLLSPPPLSPLSPPPRPRSLSRECDLLRLCRSLDRLRLLDLDWRRFDRPPLSRFESLRSRRSPFRSSRPFSDADDAAAASPPFFVRSLLLDRCTRDLRSNSRPPTKNLDLRSFPRLLPAFFSSDFLGPAVV